LIIFSEDAIIDIINQYGSIKNAASTGSWLCQPISHSYLPIDARLNPIRTNGVFLYFYDHKASDIGVSIRITYVYYMAASTVINGHD